MHSSRSTPDRNLLGFPTIDGSKKQITSRIGNWGDELFNHYRSPAESWQSCDRVGNHFNYTRWNIKVVIKD